jgi:hypothetical protein
VETGLIFTSAVGTPIDPDNFAKSFVKLCQGAGLGHWHPHEGPHSAASVMLAQGIPLMGHLLSENCDYNDLGGDYFAQRDTDRTRQWAVAQLQALGYQVTPEPTAA